MMKRLLFAAAMAAYGIGLWADDYTYPYLIFTETNGTQTSVAVADLVITVSGGQLVATNSAGTQTFTLAQLASMQFSATADGTVGIGQLEGAKCAAASETTRSDIFDLSGRRLKSSTQTSAPTLQTKKGVYIRRTPDGRTSKIAVR